MCTPRLAVTSRESDPRRIQTAWRLALECVTDKGVGEGAGALFRSHFWRERLGVDQWLSRRGAGNARTA